MTSPRPTRPPGRPRSALATFHAHGSGKTGKSPNNRTVTHEKWLLTMINPIGGACVELTAGQFPAPLCTAVPQPGGRHPEGPNLDGPYLAGRYLNRRHLDGRCPGG